MKETKKTKKTENLLEEIYREYTLEHNLGKVSDDRYDLIAVGAMMDAATLREYPRHCSARHIFSTHEGDSIYIKVECRRPNISMKKFVSAWKREHQQGQGVQRVTGRLYATPKK